MIKKIELYKFYLPNLVLDTEIIFVKETTGELFFLYEPLLSRESNINVYNFLEKMVKEIKSDDLELGKESRAFLDFIADTANYRIEDIEQYILKRYPQIYQEIKRTDREWEKRIYCKFAACKSAALCAFRTNRTCL